MFALLAHSEFQRRSHQDTFDVKLMDGWGWQVWTSFFIVGVTRDCGFGVSCLFIYFLLDTTMMGFHLWSFQLSILTSVIKVFFARLTHSTSQFDKTVLSKCVVWFVRGYVLVMARKNTIDNPWKNWHVHVSGGFNPSKTIWQMFTQGGRFGTHSTQSRRLRASKKWISRWSQKKKKGMTTGMAPPVLQVCL